MNIFEQAARKRIRFSSSKGNLTVEDLWHLPLTSEPTRGMLRGVSLDGIAQDLHRALKDSAEVSFVSTKSASNAALQIRFDLVKHIIDVRLAERTEAENAVAAKARREKIASIIAKKNDAALEGMSIEELQKLI